jgi:nickel superoxide dismutase
MSLISSAIALLDRISRPRVVYAHCDIPCGIYDPHAAQVAALTVIRMVQLTEALPMPADGADKAQWDQYTAQIARYTAVKEEHAKICEQELVILWTDYFKPEHLQKYPDLHQVFWTATKLTSDVRHASDMDASQRLLAASQQVAEIFWDSKGVTTRRGPSHQTAGGEFVYPAAA